ncbi:MAG: hypothetical protein Q7S48_01550 [bacterium]|nr:hypothetical protein [bacterium]
MGPTAQKDKTAYVVLPRAIWEKRAQKTVPSLRALREAVSRAWKGHGAADEIRAQRSK